jgi:epoxyqueuosine reductase
MVFDHKQLILIAKDLGFARIGVTSLDAKDSLREEMVHFADWLSKGYHGEMAYLQRHAEIRQDPRLLLAAQEPVHLRAIVVLMNYLPAATQAHWREAHVRALESPDRAVVSVYAHGRDYHRVLRARLAKLAEQLQAQTDAQYQFRACVDSAPVLEVELAKRCGLGWRGKHTLLLNREQGSMFFLGVLLTDMPIQPLRFAAELSESAQGHCGSCTKCLEICPTQAFVAPYRLDARRCISYLTIEHKGSIPSALRPLIGNRIYGCDDCQQACPWNQYAQVASVSDFDVRNGLNEAELIALFSWTEEEFLQRHQGSAILRIGYERWLRNLAVAMGNSLASANCKEPLRSELVAALKTRENDVSELVREHIVWALDCHGRFAASQ